MKQINKHSVHKIIIHDFTISTRVQFSYFSQFEARNYEEDENYTSMQISLSHLGKLILKEKIYKMQAISGNTNM